MTSKDQPKHRFCRDRDGVTIRSWATVLREQWELPDTVSVSALHTGKKPKSGKLRISWNEAQRRGEVQWTVREGASGSRLGAGPTLREALRAAELDADDHDAEQRAFAGGAADELRRRARESRAEAAKLTAQADAFEAAADLFERS